MQNIENASLASEIALLVETSELPVFKGKSVEEHAETWAQVYKSQRQHQWLLGAIASSLTSKYGESDISSFCALVGAAKRTVYYYAKTYKAFEKCPRGHFSNKLSFSHYKTAADTDNPIETLELADANEWSVRDLENYVFNKEQITPKSKSVEIPLAEYVHTQEIRHAKEELERENKKLKADNQRLLEVASENFTPSAHVKHNSGENEWYTPPEYIEAALKVMGSIDIDPASSKIANKTVKATKIYTKEDNGLEKDWHGNIWMNPPYSKDLIPNFISKLCYHYGNGEINQAIVLVNNATETNWFQEIGEIAEAICFINKRVKFLDIHGNEGAPLQGQALIYLGDNPDLFKHVYRDFGFCL
jgi:phage N-6-adenine-methyltransferase